MRKDRRLLRALDKLMHRQHDRAFSRSASPFTPAATLSLFLRSSRRPTHRWHPRWSFGTAMPRR